MEPRYYRGTAVLLFHGTSTVEVTVLPWYRNTTNTVVLPYGTCQQIVISAKILCDKNQVNKLEVFKLMSTTFGATGDSPMGLLPS